MQVIVANVIDGYPWYRFGAFSSKQGYCPIAWFQKGMVLIQGLPETEWTKAELVALAEPFGTPADVVIARGCQKVGNLRACSPKNLWCETWRWLV